MANFSIAKKSLFLINKGFAVVDRGLLEKKAKTSPSPIFIVGVPRSGTTLTYQLITQQFQVGYFTAPMGYLYGMSNLLHRLLRKHISRPKPLFESNYGKVKGIMSPSEHANFWYQWFPTNDIMGNYVDPKNINLHDYDTLKDNIKSITTIIGKPMVFKCLYLDLAVGALAQIFPEARFLFVRRNRLLNCQSLLIGRLKQRSPEDWWSVKIPYYKKLLTKPIWQQITEQVYYIENILANDLEEYAKGRYHEIYYENICENPRAIICEISSWLDSSKYKLHNDFFVPSKFTCSRHLSLPKKTVSKIKMHLDLLNGRDIVDEVI